MLNIEEFYAKYNSQLKPKTAHLFSTQTPLIITFTKSKDPSSGHSLNFAPYGNV